MEKIFSSNTGNRGFSLMANYIADRELNAGFWRGYIVDRNGAVIKSINCLKKDGDLGQPEKR